jgi:Na+-transporting NADH:ubiquinone oxidoreductase subunit NqrA
MTQETLLIVGSDRKETLGDKIRKIVGQLREETDIQVKLTSRILGAAAQIAENHDRLIDEVVDMVEEDLEQKNDGYPPNTYTVENLKQRFKTLEAAKSFFGLKSRSWAALVKEINDSSIQNQLPAEQVRTSIPERLDIIEKDIKAIHRDVGQILVLLQQLITV